MSMCDWCKNKQGCNQPAWVLKAVKNDDLYCDGFKGDNLPPISFGRTTPPFCAEEKSVTRRNWANVTIKRFKKDSHFLAWSKQARFGGEPIGIGKVTGDPFKQSTGEIKDKEMVCFYIAEGFKFLDEKYCDKHPMEEPPLRTVTWNWISADQILTVIPFKVIEIFPGMLAKYTTDKEIIRCVKALVKVIG